MLLHLRDSGVRQSTPSVVVPVLTDPERRRCPKDVILLYDFQNLAPSTVPVAGARQPALLQVPQVAIDFAEFMYGAELRCAIVQANQPVLSGQPPAGPAWDFPPDVPATTQQQQQRKLDKKLLHQIQNRRVEPPDIATQVNKSQRPQPAVDRDYVLGFLPAYEQRLVYYGFVFQDYKSYKLLHSADAKAQSPFNDVIQCHQRDSGTDGTIQLRISVGVFRDTGIYEYLKALHLNFSRTISSRLQQRGMTYQNGYDGRELVVANVDGRDYVISDGERGGLGCHDFKLGMIMSVGNYQFAISQMGQEAGEWFDKVIATLGGFLDSMSKLDDAGDAAARYSKVKRLFQTKQYNCREMCTMVAEMYNQLKSASKEVIEVGDVF